MSQKVINRVQDAGLQQCYARYLQIPKNKGKSFQQFLDDRKAKLEHLDVKRSEFNQETERIRSSVNSSMTDAIAASA